MGQNFIGCDREQELLLPPSLREWLPREAPEPPDPDGRCQIDCGRPMHR